MIGAAGTVLYGMIGLLGARIWIENKVDFTNPVNLIPAAIGLIMGIANFTFTIGDMTFGGVTVGTITALVLYHLMKAIAKARGTAHRRETPRSSPTSSPTSRRAALASRPTQDRPRSPETRTVPCFGRPVNRRVRTNGDVLVRPQARQARTDAGPRSRRAGRGSGSAS